jgi:hypothetical protein
MVAQHQSQIEAFLRLALDVQYREKQKLPARPWRWESAAALEPWAEGLVAIHLVSVAPRIRFGKAALIWLLKPCSLPEP